MEIAKRGGISDAEIERGEGRPKGRLERARSGAAAGADDLFDDSVVSDATWAALSRLSTEQMMDVVFTIGQYNLVSWALNSFGVPLDDFLPRSRALGWPWRKARASSA